MTIDERLEALTRTVELLAAMQTDNEKRWEQRLEVYDQRFNKIATALQQDGEHIRALVRIAELHHERLARLEDRP
jgi:hypothetical protein